MPAVRALSHPSLVNNIHVSVRALSICKYLHTVLPSVLHEGAHFPVVLSHFICWPSSRALSAAWPEYHSQVRPTGSHLLSLTLCHLSKLSVSVCQKLSQNCHTFPLPVFYPLSGSTRHDSASDSVSQVRHDTVQKPLFFCLAVRAERLLSLPTTWNGVH